MGAVARGVQWLDKNIKNWHKRVDIHKLDMERCNKCMLGQIFCSDGLLNGVTGFEAASCMYPELEDAENYGFDIPYDNLPTDVMGRNEAIDQRFAELQAEWVKIIKERTCSI